MAQPERSFRIGSCSASVFVNETADRRTFRSVSLERRYRDGEEWKSSTSFALSELPAAIAVLQLAMQHVAHKETETAE